MANLSSDSIKVFPCANRGTNYNLQARLTSEYNLTSIINQLIDTDSFVITPQVSSTQTSLSFNIHGYYFNVDDYTKITSLGISGNDIYAWIRVRSSTVDGVIFYELATGGTEEETSEVLDDSNNNFLGVNFTSQSNIPQSGDNNDIYSLYLLHNSSGTWQVPSESTVKFITSNTKRSVRIDDGTL